MGPRGIARRARGHANSRNASPSAALKHTALLWRANIRAVGSVVADAELAGSQDLEKRRPGRHVCDHAHRAHSLHVAGRATRKGCGTLHEHRPPARCIGLCRLPPAPEPCGGRLIRTFPAWTRLRPGMVATAVSDAIAGAGCRRQHCRGCPKRIFVVKERPARTRRSPWRRRPSRGCHWRNPSPRRPAASSGRKTLASGRR